MSRLPETLAAWKTDAFTGALKKEIAGLPAGVLPLEKGVTQGGAVDAGTMDTTVLSASDDRDCIRANVGVFYTEIVGGCSCGDDPFPANAYCVVQVRIDKATAEADFEVVPD